MILSPLMLILVIVSALLSGFLIGSISARGRAGTPASPQKLAEMRTESHKVTEARTQKRKDRIMALTKKQGKITNDDVEDMFCISDSTAYRYLKELEEEGKLVSRGEGSATHYIPQ